MRPVQVPLRSSSRYDHRAPALLPSNASTAWTMKSTVTTSEALALGALHAGMRFATGYPGSPATDTIEAMLNLANSGVRVEWAINEKSAFDAAFGTSLAGIPSLVCVKSVGLNVALDSLMVSNLAGGDAGFVILVGDDPGGWGSQNEEDSRLLVAAAEVPLLEPTSGADCYPIMLTAFEVSQRFRVPVVVRVTRALAAERVEPPLSLPSKAHIRSPWFRREGDKHNVLPIHVVEYHRRLQTILEEVRLCFEQSAHNAEEGVGDVGIVAAGHTYQKLAGFLGGCGGAPLTILRLGTQVPLPEQRIAAFLRRVDPVLVLEETWPYVELLVQAIAQRSRLPVHILGRTSGHIPGVGELSAQDILRALMTLLPDWPWPVAETAVRQMPSRKAFCDGCPYPAALSALLQAMQHHGGRDAYVVSGETGCMVRAQLPPFEMLDLKFGMGSSIGLAAGLVRSGTPQRVIAISGDSALLHSGLGELIDAVQAGIRLLVVVLANETTALSGGQPHPATPRDMYGQPRTPIRLPDLVRAAGVQSIHMVDPVDASWTLAVFDDAIAACWNPTSRPQVLVVFVERACPRWVSPIA